MVSALHSFIKADKVTFGARECIKNAKKLGKVIVPYDVRPHIIESLEKAGLEVEHLDASKQEITEKLTLDFFCEAFGVKK